jgi:hypothetical protein
MAWV